ncbi:MAG: DUF4349 domain-containing protein [Clostridia bacterium]|nr:DUF4349 domain-containing protein [Clostridia bacterium]
MKKLSIIVLILCLLLTFGSCAKKDSYNEPDEYEASFDYKNTEEAIGEINDRSSDKNGSGEQVNENVSTQNDVANRKLIKDVYMEVETQNFDGFMDSLNKLIAQFGGYTERSEINGRSHYYNDYRDATVVIRIPADNVDKFVSGVSDNGTVIGKTEEVTDVTLTYVDLESRIKALKTEEQTLLKLLENAASMEDTLTIQSRLSDIRYELESYQSRLRTLDSLISYSTVTITVTEVEKTSTVPTEKQSIWQEISTRFSDSWYDVTHGLRAFFVWFAGSLPHIIFWCVIIGAITAVIIAVTKGKRKKNTKKNKDTIKDESSD